MHPKQLTLLTPKKYSARKVLRPIGIRSRNHVTMKARVPVLRANHLLVKKLIRQAQLRYGVRIKSLAVMENHLHLLMSPPSREAFANFFRYLAGQLALKIGRGPLWLKRCWSRAVTWGRDLLGVTKYIERNPSKAGIFGDEDIFTIRGGLLTVDCRPA